jgi:pilus assembly protein CpaB
MSIDTPPRSPGRVLPSIEVPARTPGPAAKDGGGGRRVFLVVGAVIALIGFGLTFALGTILNRTGPTTVAVVVAARDIPARTPVVGADLKIANLPAAAVPAGHNAKTADVVGLSTRVQVLAGQPLTANLLTTDRNQIPEAAAAYLAIPAGYVAVTLPSGELQGVGGFIQPGDWITVIASANVSLFNPELNRQVSKTVFTNLHVIEVGNVGQQTAGNVSSITVVTSSCDAEYLSWLLNNAALKYVLESYKDYGADPTAPNPSCPAITSAQGVGPAQVDSRFGFSKI